MSKIIVGSRASWSMGGEPRPVRNADFSTLGIIGTAPNKAAELEFNRCYTAASNDAAFWKKLGDGPIAEQVRASAMALAEGIHAHWVTIVIVPEGESDDALTKARQEVANVAGDPVLGTGIYTFKSAPAHQARTPRLLSIAGGLSAVEPAGGGANPAVQAMAAVCDALYGFGFVDGSSSTLAGATTQRGLYTSKRLHIIETAVEVARPDGTAIKPASGYVCGLQAAVDYEHGGIPSHVAGMREIRVAGPAREIPFALNDGSTEGQRLLELGLGILVRGDAASDFAASDGGTLYIGAHTCANEPLEQFINVVRMQDYIAVNLMKALRPFFVKYNMAERAVRQAAVKTQQLWLSKLAHKNVIYPDPRVKFVPGPSAPEDWRQGKFVTTAAAEPSAPLMRIDTQITRDRQAIELEIAQMQAWSANYL
ncbi:hypothetical protein [Polycladidibacter hongkongensis]|uniref:hypothetical protein n=1 Tax=Polycladidibacter hongkongensis TaxID=1647556 RepID=UPI00082C2CD6|nr:hypothetical protein [Pseudovibrio hongkongensis]